MADPNDLSHLQDWKPNKAPRRPNPSASQAGVEQSFRGKVEFVVLLERVLPPYVPPKLATGCGGFLASLIAAGVILLTVLHAPGSKGNAAAILLGSLFCLLILGAGVFFFVNQSKRRSIYMDTYAKARALAEKLIEGNAKHSHGEHEGELERLKTILYRLQGENWVWVIGISFD